jgi:glycerol-3-phosphate dehydrogenase
MRRDLSRLGDTTFDLLVIGAGIHGACAAWDASLRGLSVAIVDEGDFGAATSANSLRIVHGGLRHLARGDLPRMLESIRERATLLRIAPGLVEPLPVLVPTYRRISRSRTAHRAALALNDLISWTGNRGLAPDRSIPRGRLVSREECLRLFPRFVTQGLTGGALWYDAQLRHPERLTLCFLCSASARGVAAANYLRADRLLVRNGVALGASVTDRLTGSELFIRARAVLVAAGPWTAELIAETIGKNPRPAPPRRAIGVNIVIGRRLAEVAVGVQARSGAAEDPVCGGRRFLFFAPQGETTLLGTWYTAAEDADPRTVCERGVWSLLREFNEACPGVDLTPADVDRYHWGWLPLKSGLEPGRATALAVRPRIVDHGSRDGIRHLLSVEGVKYTTARSVAQRAVDLVFADLGRPSPPCRTAEERLSETAETFLDPRGLDQAGIQHAVREEMALKLSDIVFRRSNLGATPRLSRATVREIARMAGAELGWGALQLETEIEDVMRQTGVPGFAMEAVG